MNRHEADPFLQGYLDAALFTTDPEPPGGCDYVESGRADELYPALPASFIEQARKDCWTFKDRNRPLLDRAGDDSQNGADFWFTRNGHGVGFWDRGYPDEVADSLTGACKKFGEVYDFCVTTRERIAKGSDDPTVRNPLQFKDVAFGAHVRWCVSEESALKFFKATFPTPRDALHCLGSNAFPPDAFWESL